MKTTDYIKKLQALGFERIDRGASAAFVHPRSPVAFTLPTDSSEVPAQYFHSIERQLMEGGLIPLSNSASEISLIPDSRRYTRSRRL